MRLENRNVIITGAAQGMGGTITRRLAEEGANLFMTARSRGPLSELCDELRAKRHKVDFLEGDCTIEANVEKIVAAALKFFDWAYGKGGKLATDLDYVPLPENVVKLIRTAWKAQIKDAAGKALMQ